MMPKPQIEISMTGEKIELNTVFGKPFWGNHDNNALVLLLVSVIPPALFLSQGAS